MGLIKAIMGAAGSTLGDQWLDFFDCESLSNDVLVAKGRKHDRKGNTGGSDNVISNGSKIIVADGQCMIIVDQGKVVEFCAVPGEFVYDTSSEPSLFSGTGTIGQKLKDTFAKIGERFTYGGETPKDQRVYYFNMKDIIDNKFGTPTPLSFRVVDRRANFDFDVELRVSGSYIFRIEDPLLFYTNITGNVADEYRRETIAPQLKSEFIDALGPAMARLSELEIRPNQIPAKQREITDALNEELSKEWGERRGLRIIKVTMNPPQMTEEYQEMLKNAQREAMLAGNPAMAGAALISSQADAQRVAAGNAGGAALGFMGMNMAMNTGGGANLVQQMGAMQPQPPQPAPQPQAPAADSWRCACGATVSGKFCTECGKPKPAATGWQCKCGATNQGKFCPQCGSPKPAAAPLYRCDKCGWTPPDPTNPPKFCPQCGDKFDENDITG